MSGSGVGGRGKVEISHKTVIYQANLHYNRRRKGRHSDKQGNTLKWPPFWLFRIGRARCLSIEIELQFVRWARGHHARRCRQCERRHSGRTLLNGGGNANKDYRLKE